MITPVLLCGGSGTRLWPLSRQSYPKQFSKLIGSESLFQASAKRLSGTGYAAPLVLTNADFRFIVTEQLAAVGVDAGAILIEPEGRNTAPAILAAALYLAQSDPQSLMLVAPSDHVVPDAAAFRQAVEAGQSAALEGNLVTFGIKPLHAETGYGYLELAEDPGDFAARPLSLSRFVEKPSASRAAEMLATNTYLWNAGIFLFTAQCIIDAFKNHAPELLSPVGDAVKEATVDLGFIRLSPAPWALASNISIDYAVMEKAENLSVVPFAAGWSDLGGWDAVWREMGPDADGVVTNENATAIECKNSLLRSEDAKLELVGIGLTDIIAVATPDAVLVADARRAQDVKQAVAAMKKKSALQATEFPKDHRPWGWFECLGNGARFQVKRIVVHPGATLSLQSHNHRAEHWIVVEGTAKVTIGDTEKRVGENESVYVPLGAKHRLENPGTVPMVLIEVQTGSYLGEDDIVRYEDVYARD